MAGPPLGARRVIHDCLMATVAFLDGGHCDTTTLIEAARMAGGTAPRCPIRGLP